jgi:hypothetical protein
MAMSVKEREDLSTQNVFCFSSLLIFSCRHATICDHVRAAPAGIGTYRGSCRKGWQGGRTHLGTAVDGAVGPERSAWEVGSGRMSTRARRDRRHEGSGEVIKTTAGGPRFACKMRCLGRKEEGGRGDDEAKTGGSTGAGRD